MRQVGHLPEVTSRCAVSKVWRNADELQFSVWNTQISGRE